MNWDGSRSVQQYWSKAVYCSTGDYTTDNAAPSGLGIAQLNRIQEVDFSVEYPLEQPTYLNSSYESYLQHPGFATVNLRWFHTNGQNEGLLGLAQLVGSGGLALNLDAEKSLYITVQNTPVDAIGATARQSSTVIGLAQGLLTQYSIGGSVGSLIESQASLACLTSFIYSGQSGNAVPAVSYSDGSQVTGVFMLPPAVSEYTYPDPSGYYSTGATDYTSAIGGRDMFVLFPRGTPFGVVFTGSQSCYLQSFNCSLQFQRQELKPMGYQYPPHRPIQWPIRVDLTTEAIVSSYQADQISRLSCATATGQTVSLIVKQPCTNATLFGLYFNDLQLVNQQFVTSIGRNDVVSLTWRGLISNPFQAFFDPSVNYLVRLDTTGAWGVGW